LYMSLLFFFSSRRRHTRSKRDWSSDVCSSDLQLQLRARVTGIVRDAPCLGGHVVVDRRIGNAPAAQVEEPLAFHAQLEPTLGARSEERRVGKEWRAGWAP